MTSQREDMFELQKAKPLRQSMQVTKEGGCETSG